MKETLEYANRPVKETFANDKSPMKETLEYEKRPIKDTRIPAGADRHPLTHAHKCMHKHPPTHSLAHPPTYPHT